MFSQFVILGRQRRTVSRVIISLLSLLLFSQLSVSAEQPAHPLDDAYEKALKKERDGRFIEAMTQLKELADQGHPGAQYYYGYMMDKANNDELAVELYTKSAEQNYIDGILSLAKMYAIGEGVEQDMARAKSLYEKAIELDSVDAMRIYGYAHQNGELKFNRDIEQALKWFKAAADKGDIKAITHLAKSFEKGSNGFSEDYEQAMYWLLKGAEMNDKYAIKRLRKVYQNGELGQSSDDAKAEIWRLKLEAMDKPKTAPAVK